MFLGEKKSPFKIFFLTALQNGRSQFVINGHWKINIPGEYNVAGTKLLYRRSADTWESFEVPGPTQEDLHIMVSFSSWLLMPSSPFVFIGTGLIVGLVNW